MIDADTARYVLPPDGSWNGHRSTYPVSGSDRPQYLQATATEGQVARDAGLAECPLRGLVSPIGNNGLRDRRDPFDREGAFAISSLRGLSLPRESASAAA